MPIPIYKQPPGYFPGAGPGQYRKLIKEHGNKQQKQDWQQQLDQIVKNWGRFEPVMTQPSGKGATVEYRFRNGTEVEFTAKEINVDKLLGDLKDYLKSNPKQLDWQKINIGDLGYRLVQMNQTQYLGKEEVAKWKLMVNPRPNHFDKRVTVTTPLSKAGAYLRHGEDGRRQHEPHHAVGRRYGHRQEAASRTRRTTSWPMP